jgi:hypothetical protein
VHAKACPFSLTVRFADWDSCFPGWFFACWPPATKMPATLHANDDKPTALCVCRENMGTCVKDTTCKITTFFILFVYLFIVS